MNSSTPELKTRLKIVTPVLNEEDGLDSYFAEIEKVFDTRDDLEVEFILVDDGSTDSSWQRIQQRAQSNRKINGIRLSRNFGAHAAIMAGLDQVDEATDAVAVLACDLQDPPQTVLEFVECWRNGADIVWGARRNRQDSYWRRFASRCLSTLLLNYAMPKGSKFQTGSFLLIDKVVLDSLGKFNEARRVTFALVAWTGFEQAVVEYDRQQRVSGGSKWSVGGMFRTAYDVFMGYSDLPPKIATMLGFFSSAMSAVAMVYILASYFMYDVVPGWTGLMFTISFFFGLLFLLIGMISEYLYRIFLETKGRPTYLLADNTRWKGQDRRGRRAESR